MRRRTGGEMTGARARLRGHVPAYAMIPIHLLALGCYINESIDAMRKDFTGTGHDGSTNSPLTR